MKKWQFKKKKKSVVYQPKYAIWDTAIVNICALVWATVNTKHQEDCTQS